MRLFSGFVRSESEYRMCWKYRKKQEAVMYRIYCNCDKWIFQSVYRIKRIQYGDRRAYWEYVPGCVHVMYCCIPVTYARIYAPCYRAGLQLQSLSESCDLPFKVTGCIVLEFALCDRKMLLWDKFAKHFVIGFDGCSPLHSFIIFIRVSFMLTSVTLSSDWLHLLQVTT